MKIIDKTIEKIYKSESTKILAVLTNIFGVQNFALAEDVMQEAFSKALTNWQQKGVLNSPKA